MRYITLLLILVSASGCAIVADTTAQARADIMPRNSTERRALTTAVILPGGGWLYTQEKFQTTGWPVSPGIGFMALTAAGAVVLIRQMHRNDKQGVLAAASGLFVVRFSDIWLGMRDTRRVMRMHHAEK